MRNTARLARTALLALAWLAPGLPSLAQAPTASMLACRSERDVLARLSCYDREADRALAGRHPASPAVPAAPAPAPVQTPAPAPVAPAAALPNSLENLTITSVHYLSDKRFVAQLDNGQSWEQLPGDSPLVIGTGQVVRIKRLMLGTYLMIGPHSRWNSRVRLASAP